MNKKNIYITALVAIALTVSLFFVIYLVQTRQNAGEQFVLPAAKAASTDDKTLIVVGNVDYAPYSFLDEQGRPTGYDVELAYRIADLHKINVEVRLMPWKEALQAVHSGQAHMITGIEHTHEDLQQFTLSLPFQNDYFVAFGRKKLNNIIGLYGKNLASTKNSGSISIFLRHYELEKETTLYDTDSEAFASVIAGENDYVITRYSVGRRALKQFENHDLDSMGPPLSNFHFGYGVKIGDINRINMINDALRVFIRDGTLDKLSDKWLKRYVEMPSPLDFIRRNISALVAILASGCVFCLLIYVQAHKQLTKAVEEQRDTLAILLEQQQLLTEATQEIYASIFEWDITHDRAANEVTRAYYESMGISADTPYSIGLNVIAEQKIEPQYREEYLSAFSRSSVLEASAWGIQKLQHEFMILPDESEQRWMRITARLFHLASDDSVRMLTFRQYIDEEKEREELLLNKSLRDPMTELYNKQATEDIINRILQEPLPKERCHALFMIDMDRFKQVNDTLGHAFGDIVIIDFAKALQMQFRGTDIVGRVGGDEFAVLMCNIPRGAWIHTQARAITRALRIEVNQGDLNCKMTASIGIAFKNDTDTSFSDLYKKADAALYMTKEQGRDGYTINHDDKFETNVRVADLTLTLETDFTEKSVTPSATES